MGESSGASIDVEQVVAWIAAFAASVSAEKDYLDDLDAAIGDADHGANLDRGMRAVLAKLTGMAGGDVDSVLKAVAMTLISTVGGASGPLYGTLFLRMASAVPATSELSLADWATALEAGVNGVASRGKAGPGDKTMLDALVPALATLKNELGQGTTAGTALRRAAEAAERGAAATIPLVARRGRASYLGERSAGHQDPGATSSAMLLAAAARAMGAE